ncbi:hypothetical protein F5Y03DRAFT_394215 [Xylaria venustula]|nr:hypothetical protein F5Y03DRAFT_394215 [Xylaria venustula]
MGLDNTEPRQSTDSVQSTTPFIQPAAFQPPPPFSKDHAVGSSSHDDTINIQISVIVLICRIFAFISSLALGITFAVLGAWRAVTIAFIVFMWISFVWHGLVLISHANSKPSVRVSLVLNDGRVFGFGSRAQDEDGTRHRRRDLRAFVIDLVLVITLFTLNVVNLLRTTSYHRTAIGCSLVPITFHIAVTVLTAVPALFAAHVRVESADRPQIAL